MVGFGSIGTDVLGRVGCGAAGSVQRKDGDGEVWRGLARQEFAKVRRGRDACGMFRQSRSLTDRTGAFWWGVLCSGSLGHERFRLARLGWAGSLQRIGRAITGEVR